MGLCKSDLRVSYLRTAAQNWPSCEPNFLTWPKYQERNEYSDTEAAGRSLDECIKLGCSGRGLLKSTHTKANSARPSANYSHEGEFCARFEASLALRASARAVRKQITSNAHRPAAPIGLMRPAWTFPPAARPRVYWFFSRQTAWRPHGIALHKVPPADV